MKGTVEIVLLQLISKAADNSQPRLSDIRILCVAAFGEAVFRRSLSMVVSLRVISRNSSADNDKQMFVSELVAAPNPRHENRDKHRKENQYKCK